MTVENTEAIRWNLKCLLNYLPKEISKESVTIKFLPLQIIDLCLLLSESRLLSNNLESIKACIDKGYVQSDRGDVCDLIYEALERLQ